MKLEWLPNEILLDIFNYFDGTELFQIFSELNTRFNGLLYNQYRPYCFQFKSIRKRHFDTICQQHLPFIADRVISISLSDHDDTPEQINLFLSYFPSWNQFIHLQSLSLSNLFYYQTLLKLLDECHHLYSLTHLKFSGPSSTISQTDLQLVVNIVWTLPKLIHCDFDITHGQLLFCIPNQISSSLKHLSVKRNPIKWNQIYQLSEFTPNLTHLSIYIGISDREDCKPLLLPTLIELKIDAFSISDKSKMIVVLKNSPNLRRLILSFRTNIIDGYEWEEVINNYLPNLKLFQFNMKGEFHNEQNIQDRVERLVDSFRTSFWIDEHRWFVRCLTWNKTVYLYSISHKFRYFRNKYPDSWRSTYPYDNQQKFYNDITDISGKIFFEQPLSSLFYMQNIERLNIKLPINDKFWSIIPSLDILHSLTVSTTHIDTYQSDLQVLLDRAPKLYQLTIHRDQSFPSKMSLCKCTNPSIRQLHLLYCNHCFNDLECKRLVNSPLGYQCEELSIGVTNCECIIYLVKNMINLRSLYIQCHNETPREGFSRRKNNEEFCDGNMSKKNKRIRWLKDRFQFWSCKGLPQIENDENDRHENISNKDALIQWLTDCLPSKHTIVRHPEFSQYILIWIY